MKIKKLLAAAAASLMVAGMTACGNNSTPTPSNPDEKVFQIGIVQLAEHPALDEATHGFKEFLTEKLGDKVQFSVQNAQGRADQLHHHRQPVRFLQGRSDYGERHQRR